MVAGGRSYTPHVQYLAKYSFVEAEEGRGCFHSRSGVINNAKAGIIMLLIKNRLSGGDYPKCMEKNMAERSQKFPIIEKITEASSRGDLTTFEYDRITRNSYE